MFIRIDSSSDIPITRQIVNQIRQQCNSGLLTAGDRLPSIRELSRQLAVNQNTVLRAYERLTADSVLERRHGDGTYVSPNVRKQSSRQNREQLMQDIDAVLYKAKILDISLDQLHEMIDRACTNLESTPSGKKGRSHE